MLPLVTGARRQPELREPVADQQRDLGALVQAGRVARVEVDDHPVGVDRLAVVPTVHWCTCSSSEARLAR